MKSQLYKSILKYKRARLGVWIVLLKLFWQLFGLFDNASMGHFYYLYIIMAEEVIIYDNGCDYVQLYYSNIAPVKHTPGLWWCLTKAMLDFRLG